MQSTANQAGAQPPGDAGIPVSVPESKGSVLAGRVISALVVLFLLFDGVTKVLKAPQVVSATVQLGFPVSTIVWIGTVLLVCTALYVIPRTSVLGALLLTGYLGGAVAANVRAQTPAFKVCFPVIFGVLVWAGLCLRKERLRALILLRD